MQHLLLLEHGEEAVQQDLEPDGDGLRAVEHQAADVEHHVGLHDLHLGWVVQVLCAQLVQGWAQEEEVGETQTDTGVVNDLEVSQVFGSGLQQHVEFTAASY